MSDSKSSKQIKVVSTGLIFGAVVLQIWQLIFPLPLILQSIASFTLIVLMIHAVEGIIAAFFIGFYRTRMGDTPVSQTSSLLIDHLPESTPLAIIKAGLYTFFVGTMGLSEIVKATKKNSEQTF
jgi:dolichyl-phosphate-mannose--protein O-mannosyl transferase